MTKNPNDAGGNELPEDPIGVVSARDYEELISGGLDPDTIREVVRMHRGLHPDANVPLSPDACSEPGHSWAQMIERYQKLQDTPQIDAAEPLRIPPAGQPLLAATRPLLVATDGSIAVDGNCPACGNATLVIGALTSLGKRSHSIVCRHIGCVSPLTVDRFLHLPFSRDRIKHVETVELPDASLPPTRELKDVTPYEVSLVSEGGPEDGVQPILSVDADPVQRDEEGRCIDCHSFPNAMHTIDCHWHPAGGYPPSQPAGSVDYGTVIDGWRAMGDPQRWVRLEDIAQPIEQAMTEGESARNIAAREADATGNNTTGWSPAPRPVGPDPADRPLYTCHVDRCGHTPDRPCRLARETVDAQHDGDDPELSIEVPD